MSYKKIILFYSVCFMWFNVSHATALSLSGVLNNQSSQSGATSVPDSSNPMVPPIVSSSMPLAINSVDTISNVTPVSNVADTNASIVVRPHPPVLPNEFQNSIRIRTGLNLTQYGYEQFNMPNSYNLINNVPLNNNYILGPGDQIFIQAWGTVAISYTATISNEGTIYIPKIGTFNISGIKAASLEGYLKNKIGSVYKQFQLSATVSKIRSIQVNVQGYAQVPGTYTVSALTNLSNVVFATGGPAANGSLRHIKLKRNGVTIQDFDMYQVLLKGNDSSDIGLLPGDIIYFEPKGNEVAIYDGVKFPAIYEAVSSDSVADILAFAGGSSFDNAKSKVIVEQIDKNKLVVNDYDYRNGLTKKVTNGEVIHFMVMNKQYDNTIVLIGNVANPTRLGFKEGMRVKDVIPNKDSLLTKSFLDSYSYNTYGKDNVLTNIGIEKSENRLSGNHTLSDASTGLETSSTDVKTPQSDIYKDPEFKNSDNLLKAGPLNIPLANINWHYAAIIRIDPKNYSTHVVTFDLEKAIEGDPKDNLLLQPGDVINVFSSKDVRNPIGYNSIFVFLDGEVNHPGVYELKPSENLTDAIKKAGGVSENAYVFGLSLQRISVRIKQKAILNQMLNQAEQSLFAQAGVGALSITSPAQAQAQTLMLQSQKSLIDKMRQVTPAGRVVLRIRSQNATIADLKNFTLEDGDTVYIPSRPNTVDVVGQVYNPATFDYEEGLSINDYINEAGTENDLADSSKEYVLQANGVLFSHAQVGWFGSFYSKTLNPGDTIIVPQKMQFSSFTQDLMSWTQILANSAQVVALFGAFYNK